MNPLVIYIFSVLGAAGLYCLMPQGRSSLRPLGQILLAATGVGLAVTLCPAGVTAQYIYFYIFAAIAVIGSVRVVTHPRPVYAALYFVLVVLSVAGLFLIAGSEFLAAALVIVYAGAILVTYLFVIMLAQQEGEADYDAAAREPAMAVIAAFALLATILALATSEAPAPGPETLTLESDSAAVGVELYTNHLVSLELAAILLLVAMVGAITVAMKQFPAQQEGD